MTIDIRRATIGDTDNIVTTLVRAYVEDPFMKEYYWRHAESYEKSADMVYRTTIEMIVKESNHQLLISDDGKGVAFWYAPNAYKVNVLQVIAWLPRIIRHFGFKSLKPIMNTFQSMDKHRPKEAHYYLNCIGIDPDHRGKGIGSALMNTILERCDRERCGAYLESTTETRQGFYKKFGFELVTKIDIPKGTVPLWSMWRAPR
jgi:ribosomal protein S18 acetylase RimI-like enzyme